MLLAAISLLLTAPEPDAHRFVFLGAGRFAQYADLASLTPEGAGGRIRVFQVVEPDFRAGGDAYWGGWSWWSFNCDTRVVDRLDFAAVREGGREGPATPDTAPPYEAVQGGDAFELLTAACNPGDFEIDAVMLQDAVAHGREPLAQ